MSIAPGANNGASSVSVRSIVHETKKTSPAVIPAPSSPPRSSAVSTPSTSAPSTCTTCVVAFDDAASSSSSPPPRSPGPGATRRRSATREFASTRFASLVARAFRARRTTTCPSSSSIAGANAGGVA
eukprot:31274-Pelagococcus_subviridis.AAC.11